MQMEHGNRVLIIPFYPSDTGCFTNERIDIFQWESLNLDKISNFVYHVANRTIEVDVLNTRETKYLEDMLKFCQQNNITPAILTNHECIDYEHHHILEKFKNILEILDTACQKFNIKECVIGDSGMNFPYDLSKYKTQFCKYITNKWVEHSLSKDEKVSDWMRERFAPRYKGQTHLLSDQRYIEYPFTCFMSRAKTLRTVFYIEAMRYGYWKDNPNMTFNTFNQFTEKNNEVPNGLATLPIFQDDSHAQNILSRWKRMDQKLCPSEFNYDADKNYPVDFLRPSPRTWQSGMFWLCVESLEDGQNYFLSEKTLWPWFSLQPTLMLGQKDINTYLESLGFDMFKDIVNYDKWDHIDDKILRAMAFAKELNESVVSIFDDLKKYFVDNQEEIQNRLHNNYNRANALLETQQPKDLFNMELIFEDVRYYKNVENKLRKVKND